MRTPQPYKEQIITEVDVAQVKKIFEVIDDIAANQDLSDELKSSFQQTTDALITSCNSAPTLYQLQAELEFFLSPKWEDQFYLQNVIHANKIDLAQMLVLQVRKRISEIAHDPVDMEQKIRFYFTLERFKEKKIWVNELRKAFIRHVSVSDSMPVGALQNAIQVLVANIIDEKQFWVDESVDEKKSLIAAISNTIKEVVTGKGEYLKEESIDQAEIVEFLDAALENWLTESIHPLLACLASGENIHLNGTNVDVFAALIKDPRYTQGVIVMFETLISKLEKKDFSKTQGLDFRTRSGWLSLKIIWTRLLYGAIFAQRYWVKAFDRLSEKLFILIEDELVKNLKDYVKNTPTQLALIQLCYTYHQRPIPKELKDAMDHFWTHRKKRVLPKW
jgi:hypothetical protein